MQVRLARQVAARYANARNKQAVLMKFLAVQAKRLGVSEHTYVVGGAVRDWLMGKPIKDVDVVIDSVNLGRGRDSDWFAKELAKAIPAKTSIVTNTYGVAILSISTTWLLDGLDMQGEVIEIANARTEEYDDDENSPGKGYKPTKIEPSTIDEDILRREFTFNTLLWRLLDLVDGPEKAEVIDLTGLGRKHLEEGLLTTPIDPDTTFKNDPTRMLRAIKFIARYGFRMPPEVAASIRRNAPKLKRMPWDAVRKILVDTIIGGPNPRKSLVLMSDLGLNQVLKEMTEENQPFANALSKNLKDKDVELLLDFLDLGYAIRTPMPFLDKKERDRFRAYLMSLPPEEGRALNEALRKPPLSNQLDLINRYNIPPQQRGTIMDTARRLLLEKPELALNAKRLEDEVEDVIRKQHGG